MKTAEDLLRQLINGVTLVMETEDGSQEEWEATKNLEWAVMEAGKWLALRDPCPDCGGPMTEFKGQICCVNSSRKMLEQIFAQPVSGTCPDCGGPVTILGGRPVCLDDLKKKIEGFPMVSH